MGSKDYGTRGTAIFAAVASDVVIVSTLSDTPGLTMANELQFLTFWFISGLLIESVISSSLWKKSRESESKRMDRVRSYSVPLLFLFFWLALVEWRSAGGLLKTRSPTPVEQIESE